MEKAGILWKAFYNQKPQGKSSSPKIVEKDAKDNQELLSFIIFDQKSRSSFDLRLFLCLCFNFLFHRFIKRQIRLVRHVKVNFTD